MFNEYLIHLCDCTWLNMLHILNYMLIKHKNILKCFNCFWKVFLFWKFSKISKTVQPCSGDSPHASSQSHAPVASLHKRFLQLIGRLRSQLQKRLRNIFQKSGFLDFLQLSLATCSRVEAPVARCTQNASQLPRRWTFQLWKILRQIFQILSLGVSGDLFVTHFSRENPVFCTTMVFFQDWFQKLFIFPLHLVTIHLLVNLSLFQYHHVHTQTLLILPHFFTNLQVKVWVLFLSQCISHFLPTISWIRCFWWYLCIWCLNMGIWCFGEIVVWVLLIMCCYTLPLVAQCDICGKHTFNDMIETLISWF